MPGLGTRANASARAYGLTSGAPGKIVATGGTETTSGAYKIHTFTSSGSFVVSSGVGDVEYLVVAGGGGGGKQGAGGGGGGGGMQTGTLTAVGAGSYTVTVGAGGAGATISANGSNGNNSVFSSVTSTSG